MRKTLRMLISRDLDGVYTRKSIKTRNPYLTREPPSLSTSTLAETSTIHNVPSTYHHRIPPHLHTHKHPSLHLSPSVRLHLTSPPFQFSFLLLLPPGATIHASAIATGAAERASGGYGEFTRHDGRAGELCKGGGWVVGGDVSFYFFFPFSYWWFNGFGKEKKIGGKGGGRGLTVEVQEGMGC